MNKWIILLTCCSLAATGCTSAMGHMNGSTANDLWVSSGEPEEKCTAEITRVEKSITGSAENVGQLKVEGSVWLSKSEIENIAKSKACDHSATVALIKNESYGVAGIGSQALILFYK